MSNVEPEAGPKSARARRVAKEEPVTQEEEVHEEGLAEPPRTDAGDTTRRTGETVGRQARAVTHYSASQIRSKPLRSSAIALVAGVILGALLFG